MRDIRLLSQLPAAATSQRGPGPYRHTLWAEGWTHSAERPPAEPTPYVLWLEGEIKARVALFGSMDASDRADHKASRERLLALARSQALDDCGDDEDDATESRDLFASTEESEQAP